MRTPARRICLITSGHIFSTPRLVKEAEALAEEGHEVSLVAGSFFAPGEPLDLAILERTGWPATLVRADHGPQMWLNRLRQHWLRRYRPSTRKLSLMRALRLNNPELPRLVDAAIATGADFFHGHCLGGLAAAAQAAARRGVPYGFDAEDFHAGETEVVEQDAFERAIVERITGAYLQGAALRTAASPLIAEEYRKTLGVPMEVVLNVFPRRHAPAQLSPARRITRATPARCYWFSQTVGPGRGLEQMFEVLARMQTPTELQLRGFVSSAHAARLNELANRAGMTRPLVFLPPASPEEMVRLAADAELGLSLEECRPRNRDLCLTNKIFVYLLAGLPQLLSRTTAQAALAPELGAAALLGDLTQPAETARQLDTFFSDPQRMESARHCAWELARKRFCWDVEKENLLRTLRTVLSGTAYHHSL